MPVFAANSFCSMSVKSKASRELSRKLMAL
jgi:hypothetical protein